MTVRVKTDAIDTAYTTEQYAVGTRYVQPTDEVTAANSTHYGDREWVFVYNDEASTAFAEGDVLFLDNSDYAPYHAILSTTTLHVHRVLGVAGHAIAAGSYGWIVVKGVCEVGAVSSVAQGDRLVSAASANATTLTTNADATTDNLECVFGMALEANGGSTGDKITAIISMPVW
jgi:predicted RecA/RadA family phage recombinase